MKRLDRYLWQRLFGPFLVGLGGFTVLIVGHLLYLVVEFIIELHVPAAVVLKFVLLQLPDAVVLALPVSTLLACSLTLNSLAHDNEITPLRASGVSLWRLQRPALVFGAAAALLTFAVGEYLVPRCEAATRALAQRIVVGQRTLALKPRQFVEAEEGLFFYAQDVDNRTQKIYGLLALYVPPNEYPVLIQADEAKLQGDACECYAPVLYHIFEGRLVTKMLAPHATINLPEMVGSFFMKSGREKTMSLRELTQALHRMRPRDSRVARYRVAVQSRFALPFSCLVFALVAGPVTFRFARGQALAGVLITVLMMFVYFLATLWTQTLGQKGSLHPVLAAWSVNSLFLVLSLVLTWRQR